MAVKAEGTKREGLFTEREKLYVQGSLPLSSKSRWKLYNKLETRLISFCDDFQLLFDSSVTRDWVESHNFLFYKLNAILQKNAGKLIPTFREQFVYRILRAKNADGEIVYWRERFSPAELRGHTLRHKSQVPKTALKGLPTRDRRLLLECIKLGLHSEIPYGRENAILASNLKTKMQAKTQARIVDGR